MAERVKKPKPPCLTKLHPGTEEVASAMGWSVETTRLLVDLPGCPRVRGGKGKRFTSVAAFKAWFEALPDAQKRAVPAIDGLHRLELGRETAALCFFADTEREGNRLALRHTYDELVALRDHWKNRDDEEEGEEAAKDALARLKR